MDRRNISTTAMVTTSQVTILRKIRKNSKEFLVSHSEEFLVTYSGVYYETHSKEFLVTNSREFLWRITWENVDQIWVNSLEFPEKSSLESIPGNYSQDVPKSFSEISWDILSIFLSKFTNKDLDPKVVNILRTIYVATPTV